VPTDDSCTACHSNRTVTGALRLQAGPHDLSDRPSADDPGQFQACRELLATDDEQERVDGALRGRLVQVGADLVAGATQFADSRWHRRYRRAARTTPWHSLQDSLPGGATRGGSRPQLKLISEWVDSGAQYFHDPFVAP
jgi:hypothetical protein